MKELIKLFNFRIQTIHKGKKIQKPSNTFGQKETEDILYPHSAADKKIFIKVLLHKLPFNFSVRLDFLFFH